MYPISNEAKALFDAEQRQVLRISGVDKNGNSINITEENVIMDGFNIDRYSCNGDRLEIGTAISAEMTVKLDNADEHFDNVAFEGAELLVEIGVADWTQDAPEIIYIPCGYFTSDEQPRSLTTITLNALDRMTRFDDVQQMTIEPWTTDTGEVMRTEQGEIIYFIRDFALPATISDIVKQVALRCDVPFTQDISAFPNAGYVVESMPVTNQDITFRNLIQWCAGVMGTNAWIDWNGELRFSWYNNATGYTSTTSNRFSSDLYESAIIITGIQYTDSDDDRTVYLAGSDEYALDVSGNELINAGNVDEILPQLYDAIRNFAYTPFSATVIFAPYLWPMDRMTFIDKKGNGHVSALTNVNFKLNGSTALQSNGASVQSVSGATSGSFTAKQAQELKHVIRVNSEAMQDGWTMPRI